VRTSRRLIHTFAGNAAGKRLINDWQSLIKFWGWFPWGRGKSFGGNDSLRKRAFSGSFITLPELDRPPVRKLFIMNRTGAQYTTDGSLIKAEKAHHSCRTLDSPCPTGPVNIPGK
jgi:hypothetical protein